MKKSIYRGAACVVLSVLFWGSNLTIHAQGRFGIGLVIGQPTGISWNYRTSHSNSVDGAIGFVPSDDFRIHVDYLWRSYPFATGNLSVHYGPGVVFGVGRTGFHEGNGHHEFIFNNEHEVGFGARGAVGLNYTIPRAPLDLYLEIAPLIVFAPNTGTDFDIGFGARVYP